MDSGVPLFAAIFRCPHYRTHKFLALCRRWRPSKFYSTTSYALSQLHFPFYTNTSIAPTGTHSRSGNCMPYYPTYTGLYNTTTFGSTPHLRPTHCSMHGRHFASLLARCFAALAAYQRIFKDYGFGISGYSKRNAHVQLMGSNQARALLVTRNDDGDILDCYGHGRCARTWKTGAAAAWFSDVEL